MATNSIDLSYLKTISMGNKDFELKLLQTFVDQTTVEMQNIYNSHLKKDWDSIRGSAHKIKSSFHFVGALKTEELLNTIEAAALSKNNFEKLTEMVNIFLKSSKKILDDVKIEIESWSSK